MLILSLIETIFGDYFSETVDKLISGIEGFWRELLLSICTTIYKWIVNLYDLFHMIGTSQILTSELIEGLYNRVGLILSIYMLFRLIFSFIQMLINPDYISDKEKGVANIVKKCLLTIILLGITPYLFEKSIEFQNFIVGSDSTKSNVIARLIMPDQSLDEQYDFGVSLSAFVFNSFYKYNTILTEEEAIKACPLFKINARDKTTQLTTVIRSSNGDISIAKYCLNTTLYDLGYGRGPDENDIDDDGDTKEEIGTKYAKYYKGEYVVSFTLYGLIAVIAGVFVCYILGTYVVMSGVRVIQLAFLRIIAPMAILSYLSPKKDTMFEKWLKMCGTTYIDLFIRLGIIYFIVFVIQVIMINGVTLTTLNEPDNMWLINLVMILALLLFAKKAPDLLKELFPKTGAASLGFGIKSPKNFINSLAGGTMINKGISKAYKGAVKTGKGLVRGTAGFGTGVLLGGSVGLIGSDKKHKLGGTLGGALRGGVTGMKKGGIKNVVANQSEINQKYRELHEAGGNWIDMKKSAFEQKIGLRTQGQKMQDTYDSLGAVQSKYDEIEKHIKKQAMKKPGYAAVALGAKQNQENLKEEFKKPLIQPIKMEEVRKPEFLKEFEGLEEVKKPSESDFIKFGPDKNNDNVFREVFDEASYKEAAEKYNAYLDKKAKYDKEKAKYDEEMKAYNVNQKEWEDYNKALARRNNAGIELAAAEKAVKDAEDQIMEEYMKYHMKDDPELIAMMTELTYHADQAGLSEYETINGNITFKGLDSIKKMSQQEKANISASDEYRKYKAIDEVAKKKN